MRLTSLVVILSLLTITSPYICKHQSPSPDTLQTGFSSGPQTSAAPFQVTWHNTDNIIPGEILANISDFMSSNILVKQAIASIHLSRSCPLSQTNEQTNVQTNSQTNTHYCTEECAEVTQCGPAIVPDEHLGRCYVCVDDSKRCGFTVGSTLGQGITGHLVVYLSAKLTEHCQDDPIQAAACQVSPIHKRPIASYMNICPNHSIPDEDLSNVLLHHLLHVMGISQNLFDLGAARLEDFGTRWGLISEDTYTVLDKQFVGTKSKEFVSKHFGCKKGYGVLMENQESRNCHVEERLYRGEILTVNVTKSSQLTDLTFSMLEDTGWYIAGKSKQPPFPGKLGCDVLDRSCNLWVSEQHSNHDNIYPFCGISSQSYTCNTQHTTVSRCQSKEHSVGVVPAKFQYHGLAGNGYRAGPYKYSDYCMLFSEHEDSYTCTETPEPNGGRNFFLEKHGPSSVCVLHDGEWDINGSDRSKGAGCYSICCRDSNFDVIDVYNEPHSCYQPKQTTHVSSSNNNIRGSLQCPSWETACGGSARTQCQSAGKCMTPSLSNGQVYSSQGMYQITIGNTLSFGCFKGFVMRGFSSSVCLGNNLFSNPVPDCKLPCEDPFIEFGTVVNSAGTQRLVGDTVTFTCDTDYKLEGSSTLTCKISSSERAGTWYPEPPNCRKEYLEWSGWGPCSVTCGDNPGERIRTRGCSTCEDFEYEKEVCFVNSTCDDNSGAAVPDSQTGANNTVILVAVFAVFFVFTIFIIVFMVWFFDKSQTQQRSQSQLFNESYYWSQQNVSGFKRRERSMDLSSEYSAASGSVKQLFTSPPSTPYTNDTQISSKGSEESLFGSGKSFHIPRIHYKNRARVFPKKPVVPIQTPPSYQESLEMPTFSPDSGIPTSTNEPPDLAKLRASIQAARVRVRNHPSVKRLFVPNPVTGGSYNPNQIPFEISEKEEENYLEDSWDFRQRQTGFKRHFGFAPSSDLKVEEEEDNKIDKVASQIETETAVASQIETETAVASQIETEIAVASQIETETAVASQIETETAVASQIETETAVASQIETETAVASQIDTETVASQIDTDLKVEEEDGGDLNKNEDEKSKD